MLHRLNDMQKLGTDKLKMMANSFDTVSTGLQAMAREVADYSRTSFEESGYAAGLLFGARTWGQAITLQADYLKASADRFAVQALKLNALYVELAQHACRPYASLFDTPSVSGTDAPAQPPAGASTTPPHTGTSLPLRAPCVELAASASVFTPADERKLSSPRRPSHHGAL